MRENNRIQRSNIRLYGYNNNNDDNKKHRITIIIVTNGDNKALY